MHTADTGDSTRTKPGFADLLDMVNPLQHIPVIGSIYRQISGDEIRPIIKIAGGALFGGPLGAAFSVASVAFNSAMEIADVPASGVDPASVANRYPVENRQAEQLAPGHTTRAGKRIMHVNADIFSNNSQNPAAHVTLTSTRELVAGRQTHGQQSTAGLQRLLGVYDAMVQQERKVMPQDPVGAG